MTYAKEGTLLELALDIYDCKSEVNVVFELYLYKRERRVGKFSLKFQWDPQPLDLHHVVERGV